MACSYPTFFCFCGVGCSSLTKNNPKTINANHAKILYNFKYKDKPYYMGIIIEIRDTSTIANSVIE